MIAVLLNWTAFIWVIFSSSFFSIFGKFIPPVYTSEKEGSVSV